MKKLDYLSMSIDDIIEWCQENGKIDWLKKTANKEVWYEVYPRVKNAEGKSVADKTQKPVKKKRKISFVQLKSQFVDSFMPEIKPSKKPKKQTMFDKINAL